VPLQNVEYKSLGFSPINGDTIHAPIKMKIDTEEHTTNSVTSAKFSRSVKGWKKGPHIPYSAKFTVFWSCRANRMHGRRWNFALKITP